MIANVGPQYQPQPQGGERFLTAVASLLGDEPIPAIGDSSAPGDQSDHESENGSILSDNDFYTALEKVVRRLEKAKKDNLLAHREIISLSNVKLPSIETMALLFNHIYQFQMGKEASVDECEFCEAMEDVVIGLNERKKDNDPAFKKLASLYSEGPSPTLLEALKALLNQAKVEGKLQTKEEENNLDSLQLNLHAAPKDQPNWGTSESSSAADITVGESGITGTDCLSSRASKSTVPTVDEYSAFSKVDIQEKSDIRFEHTLNSTEAAPKQEDGSADILQTNNSEPNLHFKVTKHYNKALHTIEFLRINLQFEAENEQDNDIPLRATAPKTNTDEKLNNKPKMEATRPITILLTNELKKSALHETTAKDHIGTEASDCDITVESSINSVNNITDDDASQESGETGGSAFLVCAFDSMLDAVVGPCCLSDDSSLSSGVSDVSISSQSNASSNHEGKIYFAYAVGEIKPGPGVIRESNRIPFSEKRAMSTKMAMPSLVESDFEDEASELDDEDDDSWWIEDVRGHVETISLSSF